MRRLKQLLPWGGTTLIAWQLGQLREAGADDVVVVLGHAGNEIGDAVPPPARVVVNSDYKKGRATSLRCGAAAVPDGAEAVLVLSVDQPRPAWLSRSLIDGWRAENPLVMSPRFERGYGHPILLDGSLLAELREVSDDTLGLRAVIDRHVDKARFIRVENQSVDVDLNTPADYDAALAAFSRGYWARSVTSSSR